MSEIDRAILGTFHNWRPVPSRKVVQLIIEVPVEQAEDVMQKLGFPQPDQDTWVAVGRLDEEWVKEHITNRRRSKISVAARTQPAPAVGKDLYEQQDERHKAVTRAGILSRDPDFWTWAAGQCGFPVMSEEDGASFIRQWCHVDSRAQIADLTQAYRAFCEMEEEYRTAIGQRTEMRA